MEVKVTFLFDGKFEKDWTILSTDDAGEGKGIEEEIIFAFRKRMKEYLGRRLRKST